jgi:sulfur carrier protein ThiS
MTRDSKDKRKEKREIKNLKGKSMSKHKDMIVHVARSGSKVIDVCLNGEHTVEDALKAAGLNVKGTEEIRVNGEVVETDYELEENDRVVLAKNIAGGSR